MNTAVRHALNAALASLSLAWLGLLFAWSGMTIRNVAKSGASSDWASGTNIAAGVRGDLLANIWRKDELIDLNGLWARLSGKRLCNGALKLKNGNLARVHGFSRLDKSICAATDDLSRFCAERGIDFLYVMFPGKIDLGGQVLPRGAPPSYANEKSDAFLAGLASARKLDLRSHLASTPGDVTRYFFRTDHHWNFTGAFAAYAVVARELAKAMGVDRDLPQLEIGNWERRGLGRRFLGSTGRRTGRFFAGMDDPVYYIPRFETRMVSVLPKSRECRRGSFDETMLFAANMETPRSWQKDRGYSVYGSDFGEYRIHNDAAPIDRHLFIVKDSFAIPVYAFLSTVFRDISVYDQRYQKKMPPADYIELARPDAVCVMYNPSDLHRRPFFEFGDAGAAGTNAVVQLAAPGSLRLESTRTQRDSAELRRDLAPGSRLGISVGEIRRVKGGCRVVAVAVYDDAAKKAVSQDCFAVDAAFRQTTCLPVPGAKGRYRLVMYAGEVGKTMGNAVEVRDIRLTCLPPRGQE